MDDLPVNIADLIVVGILLLSGLLALARGFVREVLSIAGWIGAAVITYFVLPRFQAPARAWFKKQLDIEETIIADIAAGSAIFVTVLVVFTIITIIISKRIQESDIGALDRSLGFLFGLARGAFVVCLAYGVLIQFIPPKDHPGWVKEARSLNAMQSVVVFSIKVLPKDWQKNIKTPESWTDKLLKKLNGAGKLLDGATKKLDGYTKEQRKALDRVTVPDKDKDKKKDDDKDKKDN